MGKFTGLLLVAAGVGVAVYSMPSNDAEQQQKSAARLTPADVQRQPMAEPAAIAARPKRAAETSAPRLPRNYSSNKPMLLAEPTLAKRPDKAADAVPDQPRQKTARAKPWIWPWRPNAKVAPEAKVPAAAPALRAVTARPPPKPTVITVPSKRNAAPPARFSATKPGGNKARLALVRNLQKELIRVGCYSGTIDGVWGTGTKAAMSAFTKRINAILPVKEPDYILLTLVEGYFKRACGRSCSPRETLSNDGRCRPRPIQAAPPRSRPGVIASRIDQNSARIDAAAKSAAKGRLSAVAPQSEPLATVTGTQIRTPSIRPANNDAAKSAESARRRVAARKRSQARRLLAAKRRAAQRARERQRAAIAGALAEQRAQQRRRANIAEVQRRPAKSVTLAEQRALDQQWADETAALAVPDTQARRQAVDAAWAKKIKRAAVAKARSTRRAAKRRARLRRIARAKFQRKSYLGAKKRRRTKKRRTYRRRRNNWQGDFWSSQGM